MYAPYFGLAREPFSIAPDPRFLFMSEQHREALAHLLYGLAGGGGFVLLTGEIGAGKTTVCRAFLEQVPATCAVAYVFNPKLTAAELLQTVCHEFGIVLPAGVNGIKAHVDALNAHLLRLHAEGRQAVLVIDEAQALAADVLEQLRLLTNLETAERKLLQIVLIGQPELRTMLARPELEQLAQRVIARCHLGPLNARETVQYIRHRLAVAGTQAALPFADAALARVHALSGGVPRRINLLADRALLGAYAQGLQRADAATVERAAAEVLVGAARPAQRRRWPVVAAAVGGVAALVVAWQVYPGRDASGAAVAVAAAASAPAPVASAAAASVRPAASDDPAPLLAAAHADIDTAWRELALHWHVAIGEGQPCVAALQAQLACFRAPAGAGLPAVQQLARPGIVALQGPGGEARHALLTALDGDQVALQAGSQRFVLTLAALAPVWRGDYATFWRMPPGWREGANARTEWIEHHVPGDTARPLRERVRSFQLAQGLPADGLAGPLTLMRLNRAAGLVEPRLDLVAPERPPGGEGAR